MRIAMFSRAGRTGIAFAPGNAFQGLMEGDPDYPGSLASLIAAGADLRVAANALSTAPDIDLSSVRLLPPLGAPGKILCVGLNYRDHAAENDIEVPESPEIFARFPSSLIGPHDPIVRPSLSDQLDFEGEMVAVIGKGGRAIARRDALDHVLGYSVFNDATLRDYQFKTRQWTLGKNFDATGSFGPWLVTADSLPAGGAGLQLTTTLNGVVVQDASTSDLVFDVATLIELISAVMTLNPGDVIVTGTPGGVGIARKPPLWMRPGDQVEVEIAGIGKISNSVTETRSVIAPA